MGGFHALKGVEEVNDGLFRELVEARYEQTYLTVLESRDVKLGSTRHKRRAHMGFSGTDRPHHILLLGAAALAAFLVMEAQRYRGYDLWRGRVRTLQKNAFEYGLDPSEDIDELAWRQKLSQDYRTPVIKIT